MVGGLRLLEMEQRSLVLAAIVEQVGEIDPRLGVMLLQIQASPQPVHRLVLVPQAVGRVSQAHARLG